MTDAVDSALWSMEGLLAKATLYFQKSDAADPLELGLWSTMGMELLARAVLANHHPALLAAPEGDSILSALGLEVKSTPKSIPFHTVVKRLPSVAASVTPEVSEDALYLINLRNAEVHTGFSAMENEPQERWLPKLVRVVDALAPNLGRTSEGLLGGSLAGLGRTFIDREDRALAHTVEQKIRLAAEFWANLTDAERASRSTGQAPFDLPWMALCPACNVRHSASRELVRSTPARLEDEEVRTDETWVLTKFECSSCGLSLVSTAELRAAGMDQGYTMQMTESVDDHFGYDHSYYEPEYGND